jgi:hypothetical protein
MTVIVIGYSIWFHNFSNNLTMQLLGRYSLVSEHWWLLTVILLLLLLLLILSMYFTFDKSHLEFCCIFWLWAHRIFTGKDIYLDEDHFVPHCISTAHSRILVCSTETYTRFTRQHRVISNKLKNNKIKYQVAFVNFSFSFSLL